MNNGMSAWNAKGNFLTRNLEVPAWLSTLAGIALVLGTVIENRPLSIWLVIIIIVLMVLWLFLRQRSYAAMFKDITLAGLPGYTIHLSYVPKNITPKLLPVASEQGKSLMDTPTDGVGMITSVAGNLVFYSGEQEVNSFLRPIRLTYNFTPVDEQKLLDRRNVLNQDINLIPVYLYTYTPKNKEELTVWKPFQNFSIDKDARTFTIEFQFWGDQPLGAGTKP